MVMQVVRSLALMGFALLCLAGCVGNRYEEAYVPRPSVLAERFAKGAPGPVILRPVTTEEGVLEALESGYVPLGNSTFTGDHCPWACAVDFAEKIGADLVLIDERHKGVEARTSILYLPSYQYSYSYGTVHSTAYGAIYAPSYTAYGVGSSYGTYSGNTLSTTYNAVPVQRVVNVYDQTAMFLRKGDFGDFYGAILRQSPRLPDEAPDAEIPVRVFAVLKGSQARKDGLSRGQRVLSINGKAIRTRADFTPFAEAPERIRSVEVAP